MGTDPFSIKKYIFVGQGGGSGIIVAGKAAKQENVANFFETLVIRLAPEELFIV